MGAEARVVGREELGDDGRRHRVNSGGAAGLLQPGDQAGDVPFVLLASVLAAPIGAELNLELPEGVLELHARH